MSYSVTSTSPTASMIEPQNITKANRYLKVTQESFPYAAIKTSSEEPQTVNAAEAMLENGGQREEKTTDSICQRIRNCIKQNPKTAIGIAVGAGLALVGAAVGAGVYTALSAAPVPATAPASARATAPAPDPAPATATAPASAQTTAPAPDPAPATATAPIPATATAPTSLCKNGQLFLLEHDAHAEKIDNNFSAYIKVRSQPKAPSLATAKYSSDTTQETVKCHHQADSQDTELFRVSSLNVNGKKTGELAFEEGKGAIKVSFISGEYKISFEESCEIPAGFETPCGIYAISNK